MFAQRLPAACQRSLQLLLRRPSPCMRLVSELKVPARTTLLIRRRFAIDTPAAAPTAANTAATAAALAAKPRRCGGCGVHLQIDNPDALGYVPADRLQAYLDHIAPKPAKPESEPTATSTSAIPIPKPKIAYDPAFARGVVDDSVLAQFEEEERQQKMNKKATDSEKQAQHARPPVCKRCHQLAHQNRVLPGATLSAVEEMDFRKGLEVLRTTPCVLVCVVDVMDFPNSIVPGLQDLVSADRPLLLVANKTDLLPHRPVNMQRIQQWIREQAKLAGIKDINALHFVSAKTGEGIGRLFSDVRALCVKHRTNAYIMGSTNTGKSSIINRMLARSPGNDEVTASAWPGTTLQFMRFALDVADGKPILTRTPDWMPSSPVADASDKDMQHGLDRVTYVVDTPGVNPKVQFKKHLTLSEINMVTPSNPVTPVTYIIHLRRSLMFGAMARIDLLEAIDRHGNIDKKPTTHALVTSFLSPKVTVHNSHTDSADRQYAKHAGLSLLMPPCGGPERMQSFPALQPVDITITGNGFDRSEDDIVLGDLGWVAITAAKGLQLKLRVWTPQGLGVTTRPAFDPDAVSLRGKRVGSKFEPSKARR
eukprot:m.99178 g.99178  ORF g.99178 m.99178 type:complete len:593 (+) comp15579_c0_seq1:210-1988(+)